MSRGWIIGIVCLAMSGTSVLNGWAQEGRPKKTASQSFSQRLAALKEAFRREKPADGHSQHAPQGNEQRSDSPQPVDSSWLTGTSAHANRTTTNTRTRRQHGNHQPHEASTTRVASKKRAGSVSSGKAAGRSSRYPAANGRTSNLETALSELLSPEDSRQAKAIQVASAEDSLPPTRSRKTKRTKTSTRGSFDVLEALVGKKEKKVAAAEVEEKSSDAKPSAPVAAKRLDGKKVKKRSLSVEQTPATRYRQSDARHSENAHHSTKKNGSHLLGEIAEKAISSNPMRSSSSNKPSSQPEQNAPLLQGEQPRGELLLSSQQPVIVSHVEGPRRILVGREATYQITLENTGDTKAQSIAAAVRIPKWAEIIDVTSTNGAVERGDKESQGGMFKWQLQELAARSSATLRLRLIPRNGRPMRLAVQWSQAPVSSETMVEVQEPKLEVALSGPQEVLFGQSQRYHLILKNPGTGVAERVVVQLIPPGGDKQSATTQTIGPLQPGEVKDIELELTAREAGELVMQASAIAEGGLSAKAVKKVLCRKPELHVDWRGPETKYAGTVSAYYLRVQNPGTAKTEPVTVTFELPEGSEFVSASEGHSLDKASRTVRWQLAGLDVDEAQFMQVRCQIDQPGINRFNVTAQIDNGKLSDTKTIETNVVALADLKLEVTDPQGPLPLGDSALYEIRVRNRGKTAAKGINIVGLFSAGIDPVSVEGAQYTERDGRVIFHPIKSLPAGREIVLRIRAKATQAGTHIFRAEVNCEDLEIKLAAEETTRFFNDASRPEDGRWEDGQTPYSAENDETVNR